MKYIIIASMLLLSLSVSCDASESRGRKKPQDNGRPDKTDHVRPMPLDLGKPSFTVDGYEHQGDCRYDQCDKE